MPPLARCRGLDREVLPPVVHGEAPRVASARASGAGASRGSAPALARRAGVALFAAVVGLAAPGGVARADPPPAGVSGVELVGRPDDDAPERWSVVDRASREVAATVRGRWGFAPVPPGEYALALLPRGNEAVEVLLGDVRVGAGTATRVEATSGVELVGRSGGDEPPEHWEVIAKDTGKVVAHTWQRWGFTPLPPGAYAIRLLPRGHDALEIPWRDVRVEGGRATRVAVDSGVELRGRGDDAEAPEHWEAVGKDTGKVVAHTWQRWGFTPLPPGEYAIRLLPRGHEAVEVPWRDVTVEAGATARVDVGSGVEVVGRPGQEPVEFWHVQDAKSGAPSAKVYRRWGFTPLPPGTYDVSRAPRRWHAVEVRDGEVVSLAEPGSPERWAAVSGAGRKTERERDPEGYRRLEEDVERAIRKAAAWLERHGHVASMDPGRADGHPTIGILALVHAGALERDPALARRCRDYLLRRALNETYGTYVTSITAMALCDMGALRNRARIHDCATWLVENQGWGESRNRVWGYGDPVPGFDAVPPGAGGRAARAEPRPRDVVRSGRVVAPRDDWDNSNAQFGVLGLHAASRARVGIPKECWRRVESHFRDVQGSEGGWGYGTGGETGSMTCAGVASLVIARHHLGVTEPAVDPAVLDGLEWLASTFTVEENPGQGTGSHHYYYLYGLERVGVLAETEFLGEHEWYPVGARHLLKAQHADGSWGKDPYLDTCYAILFLRRATLPLETEAPALLSVTRDRATGEDVPSVELILDCSGSMKEPLEGRRKMDIARAVVTEVLAALPAEMRVGLRLYGHRRPPQKTDTELVVPIGPLDDVRLRAIQGWIDRAQPIGWTPMVHSLLQARSDFPAAGKGTCTVVLVSDGEETGGGRVEEVEAAYRAAGVDVVIHVVGFDVAGAPLAQDQMRALARVGKGRYFPARGAKDLALALREAMPAPGVEVLDAGGTVVARAAFDGDPVELRPGAYRVRVTGSLSPPLDLALREGEETSLHLDAAGTLAIDRSE
jgi:Mg-chelatase subunit ChlD